MLLLWFAGVAYHNDLSPRTLAETDRSHGGDLLRSACRCYPAQLWILGFGAREGGPASPARHATSLSERPRALTHVLVTHTLPGKGPVWPEPRGRRLGRQTRFAWQPQGLTPRSRPLPELQGKGTPLSGKCHLSQNSRAAETRTHVPLGLRADSAGAAAALLPPSPRSPCCTTPRRWRSLRPRPLCTQVL